MSIDSNSKLFICVTLIIQSKFQISKEVLQIVLFDYLKRVPHDIIKGLIQIYFCRGICQI